MNDNELDSRLRAALNVKHISNDDSLMDRAVTAPRRPLREWLATSSPTARRGLAGSVAAIAALAVILPSALPTQSSLFSLSATASNAASGLVADNYGGMDSKMMLPYVTYNYIAGPGLSTKTGTGTVFRFELEGDVQQRARLIADALGVQGTLVKASYFDETYPTWVVGPEDGTSANLTISWSGTGSWWYNNPAAYPEQKCIDPGQPGDVAGDDLTQTCAKYEAPITGLNPSKDDAVAAAIELFTRLGYTGDKEQLTVYRDEWGTSVTAPESVNGERIALDWSMSWSGNGEIAYVGGQSARAVEAGEFATISPTDAVARLADWRWFGSAPMDGVPWMSARSYSVGGDTVVGEETDETTDASNGTTDDTVTEPTAEPTPEPVPSAEPVPEPIESVDPGLSPEPLPTPTVMDLIITKAVPQLLLVWDNNGGAWLVPGFVMTGDEGWPIAVISLIDGVIELPEPMPIEPAIID